MRDELIEDANKRIKYLTSQECKENNANLTRSKLMVNNDIDNNKFIISLHRDNNLTYSLSCQVQRAQVQQSQKEVKTLQQMNVNMQSYKKPGQDLKTRINDGIFRLRLLCGIHRLFMIENTTLPLKMIKVGQNHLTYTRRLYDVYQLKPTGDFDLVKRYCGIFLNYFSDAKIIAFHSDYDEIYESDKDPPRHGSVVVSFYNIFNGGLLFTKQFIYPYVTNNCILEDRLHYKLREDNNLYNLFSINDLTNPLKKLMPGGLYGQKFSLGKYLLIIHHQEISKEDINDANENFYKNNDNLKRGVVMRIIDPEVNKVVKRYNFLGYIDYLVYNDKVCNQNRYNNDHVHLYLLEKGYDYENRNTMSYSSYLKEEYMVKQIYSIECLDDRSDTIQISRKDDSDFKIHANDELNIYDLHTIIFTFTELLDDLVNIIIDYL